MKKCYLPITQNKIRNFLRGVTQEAFLGAAGSWTISLSAAVILLSLSSALFSVSYWPDAI